MLTIDFGLELAECGVGYSVEVDGETITIGTKNSELSQIVTGGKQFKDIVIIMSPCDDHVTIKKTLSDASFIEILGWVSSVFLAVF